MLDAGLRVSEACDLPWRQVNLADLTIRIRGKGSRDRIVPITDITAAQLLRDHDERSPWTVPHLADPMQHLDRHYVGYVCRSLGREIGVRLHPHALRHTYACACLRAGLTIYDVMRLLGHSSIETTAVYLHVQPDDLARRLREAMTPKAQLRLVM